jgi:hypothetical protein
VQCLDGRICPDGKVCDEVHHLCVGQDAFTACEGKPDETPCMVDGVEAVCQDGVCLIPVCGDNIVEPGEYCEMEALVQDSCVTFGYDAGSIGCLRAACSPDVSGCMKLDWSQLIWQFTGAWSLWGTSPSNLYAVGDLGGIHRWNGAGDENLDSGTDRTLFSVSGSSPANIIAVGGAIACDPTGSGQCTLDSGTTCSVTTALCEGKGGVITRFDGTSWIATPVSQDLRGVWVASETEAFAVGEQGTILHYDGTSWTPMQSGTSQMLTDVWGSSPTDVYAVGGSFLDGVQGVILHYNGSSWMPMTYPTGGNAWRLSTVWGSSTSDVYAGGLAGTILHYNGQSWSRMTTPATAEIFDINGTGTNDVYAAGFASSGESPPMMHYDGKVWTKLQPIAGIYVRSVFSIVGTVFAASFSGVYGTQGALWTSLDFPSKVKDPICGDPPPFGNLAFVADDDIYGFVDNLVYHFDGARWTCSTPAGLTIPSDEKVLAAHGFPNGDVLAVSSKSGPNHTTIHQRIGGTWTSSTPAGIAADASLRSMWVAPSGEIFLAGSDAAFRPHVVRYSGSVWAPIAMPPVMQPIQSIKGRTASDLYISFGPNPPAIYQWNGSQWSSITIDPEIQNLRDFALSPSTLWATGGGAMHRHTNGTWSRIEANVPVPFFGAAVKIHALADDDVFVVGTDTLSRAQMVHFTGTRLDPVRVSGGALFGVLGTPRRLFVIGEHFGVANIQMLERSRLWNCRATETSCNDGVDDDCDRLRDGDDPDC